MSTTRRNKNLPLVQSFRQLVAPGLLILLVVIFAAAQKRISTPVDQQNPKFTLGAIIHSDQLAKDRSHIRYTIQGKEKRYWLGSIADRFAVGGGWRKIAATTLKQQGKQSTDKEVFEMQFRVEVGQEVMIPL